MYLFKFLNRISQDYCVIYTNPTNPKHLNSSVVLQEKINLLNLNLYFSLFQALKGANAFKNYAYRTLKANFVPQPLKEL